MVKVTGGATRVGSVSAHLSYISRKGQLEIETDDGDRIGRMGSGNYSRVGIWSSLPASTVRRKTAPPVPAN